MNAQALSRCLPPHIARKELIGAGIDAKTVEKALERGTLLTIGRGIYRTDTLPDAWREKVAAWLRSQGVVLSKAAALAADVQADLSTAEQAGTWGLTVQEARGIARLEAWCKLLAAMPRKPLGYENKAELWSVATEQINKEIDRGQCYGRRLSNPKSLELKVKRYTESGLKALIDGNKGNANREKAWHWAKAKAEAMFMNADPTAQAHIKLLCTRLYPKFMAWYKQAVAQMPLAVVRGRVYASYCRIGYVNTDTGEEIEIGELGEDAIGFRTFYNYLNSEPVQARVMYYRDGQAAWNARFGAYVPAAPLQFVGSLWSADDYDMNFWVRDAQGRFTYRRVSMYIVWCATTGIPLGFSWTMRTKESQELTANTVYEAIYDAICFTGGRIAPEIEIDSWGRQSDSYRNALAALFEHVSWRERAQGKYAERFNELMQVEFLSAKPGYLGGNIQDRKQGSKRTDDFGHYSPSNYPFYTPSSIADMMREYRALKLGIANPKAAVEAHQHNWETVVANVFESTFKGRFHDKFKVLPKELAAGTVLAHSTEVSPRNGLAQLTWRGQTHTYQIDTDALYSQADTARWLNEGKVAVAVFGQSASGLTAPWPSITQEAHLLLNGAWHSMLYPVARTVRAKVEQTPETQTALTAHIARKERQKKLLRHQKEQTDTAATTYGTGIDLNALDPTATWLAAKATKQDPKPLQAKADEEYERKLAEKLAQARWK
jgi:hypothetical protein